MKDPYNVRYLISKNEEQAIRSIRSYYAQFDKMPAPPDIIIVLSRLDIVIGESESGKSWHVARTGAYKALIEVLDDGAYICRPEKMQFSIIVPANELPNLEGVKRYKPPKTTPYGPVPNIGLPAKETNIFNEEEPEQCDRDLP